MLLKNKKTGEIATVEGFRSAEDEIQMTYTIDNDETKLYLYCTPSLTTFNEEWEDVPEEEWRDVLGFEELYQVSNLGKVRTIKKGEAEMAQQENRNGYMTVHLRNKGVERRAMVHRLVAEAFIPNPNELRDVNHKNGNKADNRIENLEWTTHSDNMTHSFRELGKNVRHIVQIGLDGTFIERWNSIVEASEATGICRTDIQKCCKGERTMAGAFAWKYEEDYEEPKDYWFIRSESLTVGYSPISSTRSCRNRKEIGNYFPSREEAEKAVEKLKAWHKLMDYWGTEVLGWEIRDMPTGGNWQTVNVKFNVKTRKEPMELLDIIFGGEE